MLSDAGYKVYVDWVEDGYLERDDVTTTNAQILRGRMNCCRSLIYLTSPAASKSVWMPWELGYMDARVGRVAVAPIVDDDEEFEGREYLGLYPYLDLTGDSLYIHSGPSSWVNFPGWMNGQNPSRH